jgi:hypothetical protein
MVSLAAIVVESPFYPEDFKKADGGKARLSIDAAPRLNDAKMRHFCEFCNSS